MSLRFDAARPSTSLLHNPRLMRFLVYFYIHKRGEWFMTMNDAAVSYSRHWGWLTIMKYFVMDHGNYFWLIFELTHAFWGTARVKFLRKIEFWYLPSVGDETKPLSRYKGGFYWYFQSYLVEEHKICKIGNMWSRSPDFIDYISLIYF